jgi:hypothetical protein
MAKSKFISNFTHRKGQYEVVIGITNKREHTDVDLYKVRRLNVGQDRE